MKRLFSLSVLAVVWSCIHIDAKVVYDEFCSLVCPDDWAVETKTARMSQYLNQDLSFFHDEIILTSSDAEYEVVLTYWDWSFESIYVPESIENYSEENPIHCYTTVFSLLGYLPQIDTNGKMVFSCKIKDVKPIFLATLLGVMMEYEYTEKNKVINPEKGNIVMISFPLKKGRGSFGSSGILILRTTQENPLENPECKEILRSIHPFE